VLGVVLTGRFICELCLLAAAAAWGVGTASQAWSQILLAFGALLLVGVIWGSFLSPKARVALPLPARLLLEVALFLIVSAGLWAVDYPGLAIGLFVADLVILGLLFALGEEPGRRYGASPTDVTASG
jgi:hypothetical protein